MRRLRRYVVVGIASNLAGYLLYLAITYLGLPPQVAVTLLYPAGIATGFFGHSRWTFRGQKAGVRETILYVLIYLAGYLVNLALLTIFVDRLGYPHQLVQFVLIFVIAGGLFVALNTIVFRTRRAG